MKNKNSFGMILPIVLASYFIILLDNSVVFTSTVQIAQTLHLTNGQVAWITNSYALTFGSLLLIGGRLGDLYGRKGLFIVGLTIFGSGSLLVGLATSGQMLIAMRALQGVGSAIIAPTSLALLIDHYQGAQREQAISAYGITAGLGASLGLLTGGLITTFISWRWGFLINVPVSGLLVILTSRFVNNELPTKRVPIDYCGTGLSALGFLALVFGIEEPQERLVSLIGAFILLTSFIIWEVWTKLPLMPLRLFTDRQRVSAYIGRFCFAGVMISYFFLVPQALQHAYGFSPLLAALAFMPETIPQFLFGIVQSKLASRVSSAVLLMIGMTFTLGGVGLSWGLGLQAGYWLAVALPMILIGIGQGFAFGPLTGFGVAHTDHQIAGVASSVVNVCHQIGSAVWLSLIVALTTIYRNPVVSYQHQMELMSILLVVPLLMAINIWMATKKGRNSK